jgi:hypothetical protein
VKEGLRLGRVVEARIWELVEEVERGHHVQVEKEVHQKAMRAYLGPSTCDSLEEERKVQRLKEDR